MNSLLSSIYRYYVEALVDEAIIKKRSIVDLTNFDIEEIPDGLFQLLHLQKIFLNKNKILTISAKIHQWTNLTVLSLDYNKITRFPVEIKELKSLIYLNISHNPLETIPSEIGELENLEALWCNCVDIDQLPDDVCKLTKLRTLGARKNYITHLPEEFWKLTNLSWLTLENNNIEEWPLCLNALDLVHLNLSSNYIKEIPENIVSYKTLIYLFLHHNEIESLPYTKCEDWDLTKMDSLCYIDLKCNPILTKADFKEYIEKNTRLVIKEGFLLIIDESDEIVLPPQENEAVANVPPAPDETPNQPEENEDNPADDDSDSSDDDWEHSISSSQLNLNEFDDIDDNEINDYDIAVISKFVGTGS